MFTVKEAAEIMNISPHSLRFYDKEGLLPTLSRTETKRRLFSYKDLEWVFNIQCWRKTGMPLSEVKRYIELLREGDHTAEERREIILKQYARAIEEVKEAKDRVKRLELKVKWYDAVCNGASPDKFRPDMHAFVEKALAKKKKESPRIKKAG